MYIPDLSRSFKQSGSGKVTYRDPVNKNSSGTALNSSNSTLSERLNARSKASGGSGDYYQERNIGGKSYTTPTAVNSGWKPGQSYINPEVNAIDTSGFNPSTDMSYATGDGKDYQSQYVQRWDFVNPNTGQVTRVGDPQKQGMEFNAGGFPGVSDMFIKSGLARFTDMENQKIRDNDPARYDPNFNTGDFGNLKIGSQGHKNEFFRQNPTATEWDYIDYIGMPHGNQDHFARENRLNNPHTQDKYHDWLMNQKFGEEHGYGNVADLNKLRSGKSYGGSEWQEDFNPAGTELGSEALDSIYRRLTGNDEARWSPQEYESVQLEGALDTPEAQETQRLIDEYRQASKPNEDHTEYMRRVEEDRKAMQDGTGIYGEAGGAGGAGGSSAPVNEAPADPYQQFYDQQQRQHDEYMASVEADRKAKQDLIDKEKAERERAEAYRKEQAKSGSGVDASDDVGGGSKVESRLSSKYLKEMAKEYGKPIETDADWEEFQKWLRIKEQVGEVE